MKFAGINEVGPCYQDSHFALGPVSPCELRLLLTCNYSYFLIILETQRWINAFRSVSP